MELKKIEMEMPKDFVEVVDFVESMANLLLNKKYEELLALIPEAMQAVDGYQNVIATIDSQYRDEAAGYATRMAVRAFLPAKEEAE